VITDHFHLVEHTGPWDMAYLHRTKHTFVIQYEKDDGMRYQAYRAVAKVPKGRLPWTVDNRRISGRHKDLDRDGYYKSLEAALVAADAA
jgi:hypothetical protein